MAEHFDGGWLEMREPFDARARDSALAARLSLELPAHPRILDLGAGTGSLLRWLAHRIGRAQDWILMDADSALLDRAFATIRAWCAATGWKVTELTGDSLLVRAPGGDWRIERMVADLRDSPGNLPLDRLDGVVNSALCDLVSEPWIAGLADALVAHRLPFYSALNVDGHARFSPPHPADAVVARGFARDQRRDKGFGGNALGADAPSVLARLFGMRGYDIQRAASPWIIGRQAPAMAIAVANGHALAADRWEERSSSAIAGWIQARREQALAGRLSVRVGHVDVLAVPAKP